MVRFCSFFGSESQPGMVFKGMVFGMETKPGMYSTGMDFGMVLVSWYGFGRFWE